MAESRQPGDRVLGKYIVERVLGTGGMGTVYAATDESLRRTVAIKLLNDAHGDGERAARLTLREARAVVQLRSEHVARVFDAGLGDDGAPYIVMEFLEGQDLRQRLHDHSSLPVEDVVGFIVQACEGIAEAHAAGIVHRDLKPDNLFITHGVDGLPHVKVLDFGIAKVVSSDGLHTTGGSKGDYGLFGSPPYTAPERLRDVRGVDPRSDIWSLGVVLYEALASVRPFRGADIPELLLDILEGTPAPIRTLRGDVPEAVDVGVLRCLEKNPGARFQSIAELAEALLPFVPSWARAAAERTLGMAGRSRRDSQANRCSSAAMPVEVRGPAGFASAELLDTGGRIERRRKRMSLVAAALLLGTGVVVVVRHDPSSALGVRPRSAPAVPAAVEAARVTAEPAVHAELAPATVSVSAPLPQLHAPVSRTVHARATAAKRAVDPLEGRR